VIIQIRDGLIESDLYTKRRIRV